MEHVSRNTLASWIVASRVRSGTGNLGRTLHLDQLISNDNMCEVKSANAGIV